MPNDLPFNLSNIWSISRMPDLYAQINLGATPPNTPNNPGGTQPPADNGDVGDGVQRLAEKLKAGEFDEAAKYILDMRKENQRYRGEYHTWKERAAALEQENATLKSSKEELDSIKTQKLEDEKKYSELWEQEKTKSTQAHTKKNETLIKSELKYTLSELGYPKELIPEILQSNLVNLNGVGVDEAGNVVGLNVAIERAQASVVLQTLLKAHAATTTPATPPADAGAGDAGQAGQQGLIPDNATPLGSMVPYSELKKRMNLNAGNTPNAKPTPDIKAPVQRQDDKDKVDRNTYNKNKSSFLSKLKR